MIYCSSIYQKVQNNTHLYGLVGQTMNFIFNRIEIRALRWPAIHPLMPTHAANFGLFEPYEYILHLEGTSLQVTWSLQV